MTIERPLLFALAIALAIAGFLVYRALERRTSSMALAYSNLAFLRQTVTPRRWITRALAAGWIVAMLLLACAVGGLHVLARVPTSDGAVVVCVDTSGSMRSTDVAPTRSEAADEAVRQFVNRVPPGTRIGIVSFSTAASVVQPLTSDLDTVRDAITRIPPPDGATAIGDALELGASMMPNHGHRVVVLVTDGVNNRGTDPLDAARELRGRGITVYTVGIGSNSGELIPGTDEPAELDDTALQQIADETGGAYLRAADAPQLRDALNAVAHSTSWEPRRVDASLPLALGGALALLLTFFTGFALGKYP